MSLLRRLRTLPAAVAAHLRGEEASGAVNVYIGELRVDGRSAGAALADQFGYEEDEVEDDEEAIH